MDTQSAISLKGMGAHTQVQVIDHHPRSPDLDSDWEFWGEELGATTTQICCNCCAPRGQAAADMGYMLYAVGGFVRDLLPGQPTFDVDPVVERDAIKLARRLAKEHSGWVRSHKRFGSAKRILQYHPKQMRCPHKPQWGSRLYLYLRAVNTVRLWATTACCWRHVYEEPGSSGCTSKVYRPTIGKYLRYSACIC